MAVDVLTDIVIQRPREEVAAFGADRADATAWYKNIAAVECRFVGRLCATLRSTRNHGTGPT